MLRFLPFILLLWPCLNPVFAQPAAGLSKAPGKGKVEYIMEPALKSYLSMMDTMDVKGLKSYGYRIQLFSGSGANAKKSALQSQSSFLQFYRNVPSYTLWAYPNWVVRVGDFRTRLEALEFHTELRERYPASFIIKDEVTLEYRH